MGTKARDETGQLADESLRKTEKRKVGWTNRQVDRQSGELH